MGTQYHSQQEGPHKEQTSSELCSTMLPPINAMPPPAAKPALSSQGQERTVLQLGNAILA